MNGKQKAGSLFAIGLMVAASLALVAIPSDTLISYIGTENGYLFMYLIACIGSLSTFASIPYPLILISLAAAGYDPLTIGLVSALGVVTADSITFLVAQRGRTLLSDNMKTAMQKLHGLLENRPGLLRPGLVLYGTCSPLSNDFAVITLSLSKYNFWRVIPPLAIGNIIYNVTIAYLGIYAYNWVVGLF